MGNINLSKQIIHTTSLFKKDEEFNDERFMRVRVAAMHTGINRNNSRFSKECILKAKDTFANIPILADVQMFTDENGKQVIDYRGHSMHIEDDAFNENEKRIIYDEKVVGLVPETNNFELIYDEDAKEYYVWVDALLYREYGNYACDVLESRGGQTDVSMEIGCADLSYSSKDKCLDVGEMQACGLTLLGADVTPGMAKAHAEVFSMDDDNRQKQLFTIIQELKESLDNYIMANANENIEKGGNDTVEINEIVEEVTELMEETPAEVTEEVTETTEEEVTETIVEDTVEDTPDEVVEEASEENPDVVVEESVEEVETKTEETTETETPEVTEEFVEEVTETETVVEEVSVKPEKYSITMSDGSIKEFALSLEDINNALWTLVNETYSESDDTYYSVIVYEDNTLVMVNWWNAVAYRQKFKREDDNFSLVGDREKVVQIWVSESEEQAINEMKANYASLVQFKADTENAELHAQREAILYDAKYSVLAEKDENDVYKNEAYAKLVSEMDNYSLTDLEKELKSVFADHITNGGQFAYAGEEKTTVTKKLFANSSSKKSSRYGNLFNK